MKFPEMRQNNQRLLEVYVSLGGVHHGEASTILFLLLVLTALEVQLQRVPFE